MTGNCAINSLTILLTESGNILSCTNNQTYLSDTRGKLIQRPKWKQVIVWGAGTWPVNIGLNVIKDLACWWRWRKDPQYILVNLHSYNTRLPLFCISPIVKKTHEKTKTNKVLVHLSILCDFLSVAISSKPSSDISTSICFMQTLWACTSITCPKN